MGHKASNSRLRASALRGIMSWKALDQINRTVDSRTQSNLTHVFLVFLPPTPSVFTHRIAILAFHLQPELGLDPLHPVFEGLSLGQVICHFGRNTISSGTGPSPHPCPEWYHTKTAPRRWGRPPRCKPSATARRTRPSATITTSLLFFLPSCVRYCALKVYSPPSP